MTGGNAADAITHVNEPLFADISQSEPEEIWYTSFDGKKIQGWILKPPDFDPSRKYPMILEIHGGPHSAYGNTYTHEFMWMAAKGYVVLFTNPRGSTSYGQDFGNVIQYHYPGDDYKDLMAGVDEVRQARLRRSSAARRDRRQRRRAADGLDDHADATLQGRRLAARHRRLVRLLVHRRLRAVPAHLVPKGALGGSAGLRGAIADHPRRQRDDAADAGAGRSGLPHAAGRWRRDDVPRAEVPKDPDGDGPLSRARTTSSHVPANPGTASSACSTSSAGWTSGCRARASRRTRNSVRPSAARHEDHDASKNTKNLFCFVSFVASWTSWLARAARYSTRNAACLAGTAWT